MLGRAGSAGALQPFPDGEFATLDVSNHYVCAAERDSDYIRCWGDEPRIIAPVLEQQPYRGEDLVFRLPVAAHAMLRISAVNGLHVAGLSDAGEMAAAGSLALEFLEASGVRHVSADPCGVRRMVTDDHEIVEAGAGECPLHHAPIDSRQVSSVQTTPGQMCALEYTGVALSAMPSTFGNQPTRLEGDFRQISCDGRHFVGGCGVLRNGQLRCWGQHAGSQPAGDDFVEVSVVSDGRDEDGRRPDFYACARRDGGHVVCFDG